MVSESRIVCAAIRSATGIILTSPRHFDCFMHEAIRVRQVVDPTEDWISAEQGFVDQHGRFFCRSVGYQIALKRGQINRSTRHAGEKLFSEDLY